MPITSKNKKTMYTPVYPWGVRGYKTHGHVILMLFQRPFLKVFFLIFAQDEHQQCGFQDDLLNIDNPYFERMLNQIYPPELQLNKANTSDTGALFLDLHLSISNGFVSSKNL